MTGASLPPGANAVVMVEDTDFNERIAGSPAPQTVAIYKPLQSGENVRRRGDDLHAGDKVLSSGTRLRAQEVGLLAMLGLPEVPVYRSPKVALLSSGDELLPVEVPLTSGKIMMPTLTFGRPVRTHRRGAHPARSRLRYGNRHPVQAGQSRRRKG